MSCVYEKDLIENHNHNSRYSLYEKKFEELITDSKFIKSFESLPKKKKIITSSIMGRTVMEDEYGFTISELPAKIIHDGNKISYTFLITRDSIYSNVFENLIVQTDSLDNTSAYIIKYNLTSQIIPSEHNLFNIQSTKEITPIVYNNQQSESGKEALPGCTTVYTLKCTQKWGSPGETGPIHNAESGCILEAGTGGFLSVQSEIICTTSGGTSLGTGINNNTTGTGTQTTGTGGGTYSNVITSPVFEPCETCPEFDSGTITVTPCESLNKLAETTDQNINPSLQFLKDKLDSGVTTEWGVQFNYNVDVSPAVASNQTIVGGSNSVDFALNWNQRGSAHLHTTAGYGMFSWGDVNSLAGFYDYASPLNQPYVTSIMVCNNLITTTNTIENYNVYAIKVDNYTTLSNAINNTLNNNPDYNGLTLKEKIKKIHEIQADLFKAAGNDNLEKSFLQQFASYGISLYKKKPPINSASTENWVKLTINPITNTITETPC